MYKHLAWHAALVIRTASDNFIYLLRFGNATDISEMPFGRQREIVVPMSDFVPGETHVSVLWRPPRPDAVFLVPLPPGWGASVLL
jgi:hypothetical protein